MFSSEYDRFNDLIKSKNVLCIPIFSMFDHQTHICNMACDGNVSRYITTFYKVNSWKSLTTFCPTCKNASNIDFFIKGLKSSTNHNQKLNIFKDEEFKNHAAYLRGEEFANNFYDHLMHKFFEYFKKSDFIIFEGQDIGLRLLDNKIIDKKYIYWCPVCATNEKTRSFLEINKEKDQKIFELSDYIIVASKDQVKYLNELGYGNKVFLFDQISSRDIEYLSSYKKDDNILAFLDYLQMDYKYVIYMPYRISDEGYQVRKILDILFDSLKNNFVVFCPNLNNDNLIDEWTEEDSDKQWFATHVIVKVDSNKDTYFTLLDCGYSQVIIPYFEDTDFIMHGIANELKSDKTTAHIFYNIDAFKDFVNYEL